VHSSRQSDESFSVNRARNVWACQSASCIAARGGRTGGNVLDLVAILEHCSLRQAAIRIRDTFGAPVAIPPRPASAPGIAPEPNRPLGFVLRQIDCYHPYLPARSITPHTARIFGVGFYRGTGFLQGRIVIPIHNENHQLIAYAGRAIDHSEPKYRFPAGFRKSQILFNLNRARRARPKTVIVVEGFFDTLKIHQAGYHNGVALMSCTISAQQAALLETHFARAVLLLDGDPAGRRGSASIAGRLRETMDVAVVHLADGVQPDQLASKEIAALLGELGREPPTLHNGKRG
jgi:DNA primase